MDEILENFLGTDHTGLWADPDAEYLRKIEIDLNDIFPVVAAPHHVDNVKAVSEVQGTKIQEALVGTCTNGRIEDLREGGHGNERKEPAKIHADAYHSCLKRNLQAGHERRSHRYFS